MSTNKHTISTTNQDVENFEDDLAELINFTFDKGTVAVEDIANDEKSLKKIGRWPWSRNDWVKFVDILLKNCTCAVNY